MMETPKPTATGSSGTQKSETIQVVIPESRSPIEGLPITQTVMGLAETSARSMGGEVTAKLLAGSFAQISQNLQETKRELQNTNEKLEITLKELSDNKTKVAVLKAQIDNYLKGRHLKKFSIFVGTTLVGIGIEFYRNNFNKFAFVVAAIGVILMFLGWFSKEGGAEK